MSNKKFKGTKPEEVEMEILEEEGTDVAPDTEPVEEVAPKTETLGEVIDCYKLNVRKKPNIKANVITEIAKGTKVIVDVDGSAKDWYKVTVSAGVEGFCMKKFIKLEA